MANRLHLRVSRILIGFAAVLLATAPAFAATATSQSGPTLERGTVRQEYPVWTNPSADGSRAARGPHRTAPPLQEVVVFQDSLNALSISNQGDWTHLDNSAKPPHWHIDTVYGCQGHAWWCGLVDSSWIYDPNRYGYGNSWNDYLQNAVYLDSLPNGKSAQLSFRHHFDAESGYDFGYVEVLDMTDDWTPIAQFTGKVPNNGTCDSVTITIPDSIATEWYANVDPGSHFKVPFRFHFVSDIAYSSEDGLYAGDGWSIDNITIKAGNQVRFFDNCEGGQGQWNPTVYPPVGDLFSISSNVYSEDVCTTNRTNVWSDWDPTTYSVVPRLDNLLRTPAVFINRPSEAFVAFDVYRNLPLYSCFYYHLRYRTRNVGDPDWSEWADPTRLVYYGATKDWARQKVVLPGGANKDSVQVEFGVTDYSQIYCDGVSSSNGVYTFFDNVAVGVVRAAPPIFIQHDEDLFNDTFSTTAFFKDDNFNSPLGDSTVVEVSTSRGYKTGYMFYRMNGGSWLSTPLGISNPAVPTLRYADVPPGNYPANTFMEYYFQVTDSTDSMAVLPVGAISDHVYFNASILPLKSATNPSLSCFDSTATILFVNNYSGREPANLWLNTLRSWGYKVDVWNVNSPTSGLGNTPGGASTTNPYDWPATPVTSLTQYSTILWHAGSLTSFTLSPQDQALFQSWIQQTGKSRNLWIAGDNVANDLVTNGLEYNSFLGFTCGVFFLRDLWESLPQDTLHPVVSGVPGSFTSGLSFHVNLDCPIIDKPDLIGNSSQGFQNGITGTTLKYPNGFAAATRYATKYVSFGSDSARVLFQAFNFDNIEDGGQRLGLAKDVVNSWFKENACYAATDVPIDPSPGAPPARNELSQNFPNPFNPSTAIHYSVAQTGPVAIRIFNAGGALVRTLVNGPHTPGDYTVRWDGKDDQGQRLGSGVYFYRIETGSGFRDAKKLILLK